EAVPYNPLQPAGRLEQRIEVDARLDAVALELPDEVLGGDVAGRARRVRAAAEAADRRVEHLSAAVERRPGAGVAGGARVVQVRPDGPAEDRDALDQPAHPARGGHAD